MHGATEPISSLTDGQKTAMEKAGAAAVAYRSDLGRSPARPTIGLDEAVARFRDAHGWAPGTEFEVESTADGVRLRAKAPFPRTELGHVFGSLSYAGPARTFEEMDEGIRSAVARRYRRTARR